MVEGNGAALTGRLAATRPGVELALLWAFVGLRSFVLAQGAIAVVAGSLSASSNWPLDAALLGAAAAESLMLGWWLLRRRSTLPLGWPVAVDLALSVLVLALAPAYIPVAGRIDSWTFWAYPFTLSATLLVGAALPSLSWVLAVSGAQVTAYIAVVAVPLLGHVTLRMTAVVNALSFLGFAVVAFLVARFMRGLADAADIARKRVAELEQERSRAVVHDLLPYLRLDRFAAADDQKRAAMLASAEAKHQQMRSYVDGAGNARNLADLVGAVVALHPGLPVRTTVEAGADIRLAADVVDQLERALDTTLANVDQHAAGSNVVMSLRPGPGHVTFTVADDGPGFDTGVGRQGFGIGEVLGRQLEAVGGRAVIESRCGVGTTVHITVPVKQP